jgi:hypothetical protein
MSQSLTPPEDVDKMSRWSHPYEFREIGKLTETGPLE